MIIQQDKQYEQLGEVRATSAHAFFAHFHPHVAEFIDKDQRHLVRPAVQVGQRVQFKAKPAVMGKTTILQATHVRPALDSPPGTLVTAAGDFPLMPWRNCRRLIRHEKVKLGVHVYASLSRAANAGHERTTRDVDAALRRCRQRVAWLREQVHDQDAVALLCQAELGAEMYDLLERAEESADDLAARADAAYLDCLWSMEELGLELSGEQVESLREYREGKGWTRTDRRKR